MATRWDKFLNEASRGYGVGFQRYQQYADARDKRLNREDMAAVAAGMQQLENAQAIPVHGQMTQFEDPIPVPVVPQIPTATGGGGETAVPTSAPTAPPAMLDRDPTRRDLAASAMGYADSYLTPPSDSTIMEDRAMRTPGLTPEQRHRMFQQSDQLKANETPPSPLRPQAEAKPEEKPKAVEESTKKGEGKTAAVSANQALQEVTMQAGPNKGKVPVRIDVSKYSTDTPTAEVWNTVRDKLMQVAIRNGDYESVIAMPEKIAGMQQQGFLRHMEQALQVQNDPEALAAVLTKAYSYYPDGTALQFQVQDGQLYGYGFDESTGEFQGGTLIDNEAIARAMEQASDPVNFYKEKRAAELAARERREDLAWKQKEYNLEVYKARSADALNQSRIFENIAQGNEIYAELNSLNPSSVMAWENGYEDVHKNKTQAVEALDAMYQNKKWPDPRLEMLVGEDGLGYRNMVKIVDSIAGNVVPAQNLGMEAVPMYAAAIGELELLNSRRQSGDANADEFLEAMGTANVRFNGVTGKGNLNISVDGMPLEVSPGVVPGLYSLISSGELRQMVEEQASPTATTSPYAPVEGEALNTKQALGVIGTRAGEAASAVGDAWVTTMKNTPPAYLARKGIEIGEAGLKGLGEALR